MELRRELRAARVVQIEAGERDAERIEDADEALTRLMDCLTRLDTVPAGGAHDAIATQVADARLKFDEALGSDLNTSGGLAAVFDLVRVINSAIDARELSAGDATVIRDAFREYIDIIPLHQAPLRKLIPQAPNQGIRKYTNICGERMRLDS